MTNYDHEPKSRFFEYFFLALATLVTLAFVTVGYLSVAINNFWGHDPVGNRAASFFFLTFFLGAALWGVYAWHRDKNQ